FIGAIALWIVGRALIGFCVRFIGRWLTSRHVDATLGRYIASAVSIGLNIVLAIAILSLFGVETTTFAAFIAAAGVAIGIAWGGLLGNFAAGVFLVIFRPFKSGDFISPAGARRGDSPVQPGRAGPGRAAVLRQRALLAGVLRHEPDHPRGVQYGSVSGARAALPGAEPVGLSYCWPRYASRIRASRASAKLARLITRKRPQVTLSPSP